MVAELVMELVLMVVMEVQAVEAVALLVMVQQVVAEEQH